MELCWGALGKGSAPTQRQALQVCTVSEGLEPPLLRELQSHRNVELDSPEGGRLLVREGLCGGSAPLCF